MDYSSAKTCREFAKSVNATYDEATNQILYGQPLTMSALGVNDGNDAHSINQLLKLPTYSSGEGVASGGCNAVRLKPYNYTVENFDGKQNDYWFETLVFVIFVLSILYVCQ